MKFYKIKIIFFILLITYNLQAQQIYKIVSLPFNTKNFNEVATALYNNDLIVISDRKSEFLFSTLDQNNNFLSNIYISYQKKPGEFSGLHIFAQELTTRYHEGWLCFSNDYKIIYFTRTIEIYRKFGDRMNEDTAFGIFYAKFVDNKWSEITAFPYNRKNVNIGFPSLDSDGKILFFCSHDPAGFGGYDIWYTTWQNSRWTMPRNLGNIINTPENEIFPYYHPSGRLYFASRGHDDKKDFDIFYTFKDEKGDWIKPIKLPYPYNTNFDDLAIVYNNNLDTAYVTSTRDGSMDVFMITPIIHVQKNCPQQVEDDFCYLFYDERLEGNDTLTLIYEWDLGDGTKKRGKEVEHCYLHPGKYIIRLNLLDSMTGEITENFDTYEFVVEPTEQPYIKTHDTAYVDDLIEFDARKTYLKNVEIQYYTWDFGDGTWLYGEKVSHKYIFPGIYNVNLGIVAKTQSKKSEQKNYCVSKKIVILKK